MIFSLVAIFLVGISSVFITSGHAQAVKDTKYLWKGGIIPYEISSGYNSADKKILMDGINEYAKYTCIKLVPRTNQADYVLFSEHSSGLCFGGKWGDERVGFLGGRHDISLIKSQGCLRKFNVIHELMHLLGFWHEQQREDRDIYTTINTANVNSQFLSVAFKKLYLNQGTNQIQYLNTPYDYDSIMHYHAYSFAINPSIPTIKSNVPCKIFGNEITFSKWDVVRVNRLYNCPANPTRPTPPDYQPKNQCTDDNSNCPSWAKSGECTANPGYMKVNCKKSCNTCSISQCQESNPTDCANRAASGQCTTNTGYMKVNCKKACNLCC